MYRYKIFFFINILFFCLWIFYLFTVQILDPHHFEKTIEIRQNPAKEIVVPYRGNIYDRNKELLVSSTKYYQIDIDRFSIQTKCRNEKKGNSEILVIFQKIANIISKSTDISETKIYQKLSKEPWDSCTYISENITESQLTKIRSEFKHNNIPGLVKNFSKIKRSFPKNKLAARQIGMVKKNEDRASSDFLNKAIYNLQGISGLEASFDNDLTGIYGWKEIIHDANNKVIPFLFLKERKPKNGNSLILTIDSNFQEIMEEYLSKGIEKYEAKNGIGIIMKVQTGEIMAMAGISDQDKHKSAANLRSLPDMPVSFMFEPGSTLKPFTALIAIENRLFKPDDMIDCRDYHLENRIITDAHEHDFRKLSFKDIIAYSSNVGISKIVEKIGNEKLYNCLLGFGFGHKTGSNIYGESDGIFRKMKDWQGFSLHSISFGQEISVTALQLCNAYCALANDGKILRPYIVSEIRDEQNKIVRSFSPQVLRNISNRKSLNTLKDFLQGVVDYGTAKNLKMEYLSIAGKTGTAEKAIDGAYSEDKYTAVFAGFFPVKQPQYAMVIVYDEPDYESYAYYSTVSAVPTFKNIVQKLLHLPKCDIISEIKENRSEFISMPNLMDLKKKKAQKLLEKNGIKYNIIENDPAGLVVNQFPKQNVNFDKNEIVQVIIDIKKTTRTESKISNEMPDLVGLTVKNALKISKRNKIKLNIVGKGIVSWQSIPKNSRITYGEQCKIRAK